MMSKKLYTPASLGNICCQAISENATQLSSRLFVDLNRPCLMELAPRLSFRDLMCFGPSLEVSGIDLRHLVKTMQYSCLYDMGLYPMKSTTLPHLRRVTSDDSWDNILSRLLHRKLIIPLVEAHGAVLRTGKTIDDLDDIALKHEDLQNLFLPRHKLLGNSNQEVDRFENVSHKDIIDFCAVVAHKIFFVLVDLNFCEFISNPLCSGILTGLCQSLKSISVLSRSSEQMVDFLNNLRAHAKNLDRVCLYGLRSSDLKCLDEIMSTVSGVVGFYETDIGVKEESRIKVKYYSYEEEDKVGNDRLEAFRLAKCRESWSAEKWSQIEGGVSTVKPVPTKQNSNNTTGEADLMDDVLLAELQPLPCKEDSTTGVSSFAFKASNLVSTDIYIQVLDHHFKHWQALTHLEFGAPGLGKRMSDSLCVLIERSSFKSLTITGPETSYTVLEDILVCIATTRKRIPLDEFMLVDLQQSVSVVDDLKQYMVSGRSGNETQDYIDQFSSDRLARQGNFKGCKLFELSGCNLDAPTQCLMSQYLLGDEAVEELYLSNTFNRFFMKTTLEALSERTRRITNFILQECCLSSLGDFKALTLFLEANRTTLKSLGLKTSFCFPDTDSFMTLVKGIVACTGLTSLDMSSPSLAPNVVTFIHLISDVLIQLREFSFRKSSLEKKHILEILHYLADHAPSDRPMFDFLDLSGNQFVTADAEVPGIGEAVARITRRLVCDDKAYSI